MPAPKPESKRRSKQVGLFLDRDTFAALQERARAAGRYPGELARHFVEQALASQGKEPPPTGTDEPPLHIVQKKSGGGDGTPTQNRERPITAHQTSECANSRGDIPRPAKPRGKVLPADRTTHAMRAA